MNRALMFRCQRSATVTVNVAGRHKMGGFGGFRMLGRPTSARHATTTTTTASTTSSYLTATLATAVGLGLASAVYVYLTDTRASVVQNVVMPLIHATTDPEDAHVWSIAAAKYGLVPQERVKDDSVLKINLWNKEITNPVGLAAGYDKHAEAVDSMFGFGFGLVEVGSVTPKPQPGNPKPRLFRLTQDKAAINCYGFNSVGHEIAAHRLLDRVRKFVYKHVPVVNESGVMPNPIEWIHNLGVKNSESKNENSSKESNSTETVNRSLYSDRILGINLGKNKSSAADSDDDYLDGVSRLGPYADYIVINISCPNLPGLGKLQESTPIRRLLSSVIEKRNEVLPHRPPIVVKISPDLSDEALKDVADVVMDVGVDGVVISNCSTTRPKTLKSDKLIQRQAGGLSGPPILPLALSTVSRFYKMTNGKIPIIGCGGIQSGKDAIQFARAGASLVQLYTSLAYDGPGVVYNIKREVTDELKKMNMTWKDLIGADHKQQQKK